ncbi:hypothetical protein [Pleionea mediterranea]|jgi:hypothetical protein|uniref:DUF378 domain-containing protein n=1 Tax=Pleionea mediterranea TaxID=523701 RepID=A0A316FYV2_9GAMM|nr:hypothetical protein [Pleionea mediterranea]PWK52876.1 hypothetical protein C8D97_10494 [Pleionea mediterranea]
MKSIGIYLVIAGIGSILLNQFGYEFKLLMWIDNWGETIGWLIRGSAIVVGAGLFFIGNKQASTESQPAES